MRANASPAVANTYDRDHMFLLMGIQPSFFDALHSTRHTMPCELTEETSNTFACEQDHRIEGIVRKAARVWAYRYDGPRGQPQDPRSPVDERLEDPRSLNAEVDEQSGRQTAEYTWETSRNDSDVTSTYKNAVSTIDYRCEDGSFWLPAHDCQVPTPASQNLKVEQQIRIFGITISRITNIYMLELMHQEQTNSSIAWKIGIHNS
jgi:hypothetical protein